ncbi:hypothetical protein AAY84_23545 [Serratia marcescens]|uniref:hypothetical protein n=1 Tax=Serratia TaxID=613 RepID=UPI00062C73D9|nr:MULTISPECIES: hypothetical protein [Serratia]KKZ16047.1 hypothetical protein AAY84_23545 [Serratia marcescens]MCH6195484.1 hypothetical protein [Serratia sp. X10]MDI3200861.1 hypothetical protein [Serratia ureilytica]
MSKKSSAISPQQRLQQEIAQLRQDCRNQQRKIDLFLFERRRHEAKLFWLFLLIGLPLGAWLSYSSISRVFRAFDVGFVSIRWHQYHKDYSLSSDPFWFWLVITVYVFLAALIILAFVYLILLFSSLSHSRLTRKPPPVQEAMQKHLQYLQTELEKREQRQQ